MHSSILELMQSFVARCCRRVKVTAAQDSLEACAQARLAAMGHVDSLNGQLPGHRGTALTYASYDQGTSSTGS